MIVTFTAMIASLTVKMPGNTGKHTLITAKSSMLSVLTLDRFEKATSCAAEGN